MILLRQTGSLKIGEVYRYTVTYVPSRDSAPYPSSTLYLRIKNNCSPAHRAAFMRGPYHISVAAYPATYNPNEEFKDAESFGSPQFEPNLRAGGTWSCILKVPKKVRDPVVSQNGSITATDVQPCVTWIVEVSSQVIFSTSAAVQFEVLLARNKNSFSTATPITPSYNPLRRYSVQLPNETEITNSEDAISPIQSLGVFVDSIELKIEDTAMLWNEPSLPENLEEKHEISGSTTTSKIDEADHPKENKKDSHRSSRPKKFHLVILTHGLHSNIGADMLYLKESIDATAKQARDSIREKKRRDKEIQMKASRNNPEEFHSSEARSNNEELSSPQLPIEDESDESDNEEEVIVRGFSGNVARTERGIKYLGKRLARYVISMTYPDQLSTPVSKKHNSQTFSHTKKVESSRSSEVKGNFLQKNEKRAYKFTSISFIAHSLGGIVQTYAVAYIQKHWPPFFDEIKPINFIALASPFLGLSNENPLYVKFALDFGFVGRTGQDLGLTWSAPTIAKSSWGAIVGGMSESTSRSKDPNAHNLAEDKPLLQVLPMGPAHFALKKFKTRTIYSNIVNDGIVPLRTSCLLFIDWHDLGKIEKARKESGLIGKFAEWGWAEITGATSSAQSPSSKRTITPNLLENQEKNEINQDHTLKPSSPLLNISSVRGGSTPDNGLLSTFVKLIIPSKPMLKLPISPRTTKIYERNQNLLTPNDTPTCYLPSPQSSAIPGSACDSATHLAPPRTSLFESAGNVLRPPLPTVEYLLDFFSRPQTIFHDRIYTPSDIPPLKHEKANSKMNRPTFQFFHSPIDGTSGNREINQSMETGPDESAYKITDSSKASGMKIEEKIARAYHRDLTWRKVLVRLEPDAHNNMIVRRMFANAYGWPVVKHLCDQHFSESAISSARHDSVWSINEPSDENNYTFVNGELDDGANVWSDYDFDEDIDKDDERVCNLGVEPRGWL